MQLNIDMAVLQLLYKIGKLHISIPDWVTKGKRHFTDKSGKAF